MPHGGSLTGKDQYNFHVYFSRDAYGTNPANRRQNKQFLKRKLRQIKFIRNW